MYTEIRDTKGNAGREREGGKGDIVEKEEFQQKGGT